MFQYSSNFIHNYRRDGIVLDKSEKIVYHYTSPEGLLGILNNQNVRFTDIRYMNDRSEGVYFIKKLIEYIEKNKSVFPHAETIVNSLLQENDYNEIKRLSVTNVKFKTNLNGKTKSARTFLFCTCTDPDLLNMWNYYVKNGAYQGYSIGFNVSSFLNELGNIFPNSQFVSIYYGKVLYSPKEQEDEIKNLLQTIENSAEQHLSSQKSATPNLMSLGEIYLKEYIDLYGVFFKHPKFSNEQEYRFVVEFDDYYKSIQDYLTNNYEDKTLNLDFCIKNGMLTPYLKIPYAYNTISRIYISPMTEFEISKQSIKELARKKGYRVFSIWQSKIPIRY